ncbi:MAG: AraC family transcriptional regulator [Clostridia bacterium]|nr:AraC family transcriptional regulator [Clostridia bacterium]
MLSDSHPFSLHENMEFISQTFFEALKIPVFYLNEKNEVLLELNYNWNNPPFYSSTQEMLSQLLQSSSHLNFPVFVTTKYFENYFFIRIARENSLTGTIVAGPSIPSKMDEEKMDRFITDLGIPMKQKLELLQYYQYIPVIEYNQLIRTGMLLHYLLYQEKLDFSTVLEKNSSFKDTDHKMGSVIELDRLSNRQNSFFHHTTQFDKFLTAYVKNGEKDKLIKLLNAPRDGQEGILAKNNPLRSSKNLFICMVTIITRAAIDGGLAPELAYTISDSYIQHVEELNEIKEVVNLRFKACCDFAERVHILKQQKYSNPVNRCISYITDHLFEEISLAQLAKTANLNSNYFCELFKKETGISPMEYIQRERIETAKNMLVYTNYSVFDICIYLNFNDQSYFTKIFKKHTGATPKQYRNQHAIH